MGNDARINWVQTNGKPAFSVEVCSEAARSWVTLTGELDLASAPQLQQVLDQLCWDGFQEVVLDLAGLDFLGAIGLEVFVRADDQLRAAGGRLILHRPGPLARRILAITELDTVLTIQPVTSHHWDCAATSGLGEKS
ncbi:MAG TPA: STAS domain-containing protein [Pseudonocardiaceae bacterium]|nr:STAS domain-containing protein [Pseudonocardiaceae bacterium]